MTRNLALIEERCVMIASIDSPTGDSAAKAHEHRDRFAQSLDALRRQMLRETEAFLGRRLRRRGDIGFVSWIDRSTEIGARPC